MICRKASHKYQPIGGMRNGDFFLPDDTFNDRDVMISVSDSGTVSYLGGSNGYTAKIQDAINRTRSEFMYIGMLLLEVDAYGYYTEAGFSDVYEYAETTFGFKRSSTNNFMRVYRKFGEAMGIQDRFKKFSYSQLVEMCSMNDNQIASCSPEMSVLRLREVKKGSSVQTSGRQLSVSSNSSFTVDSLESVINVSKSFFAKLHCPICDYTFYNNIELYRFCPICSRAYEQG